MHKEENYIVPFSLSLAWTCRPAQGFRYGPKYVYNFRDDIEAFFDRGVRDKSCRMSADLIHDELELKYPRRYDIPAVAEIKSCIQQIMYRLNRTQQHQTRDTPSEFPGARGRRGVHTHYIDAIRAALQQASGKLSTKEAISVLSEQFDAADPTFPSKTQFNNAMTKMRKENRKTILNA